MVKSEYANDEEARACDEIKKQNGAVNTPMTLMTDDRCHLEQNKKERKKKGGGPRTFVEGERSLVFVGVWRVSLALEMRT